MSQEDLGGAAGIHPAHVSLIESGKREVKLLTIERLAAALGVQPSTLMPKIALDR